MLNLSNRELATVLAALRMWQRLGVGHECEEQDIATDGGEIKPMHDHDIDALCERMNFAAPGQPDPWHLFRVTATDADGVYCFIVSAQSASESKAQELAEAAALDHIGTADQPSTLNESYAIGSTCDGDVFEQFGPIATNEDQENMAEEMADKRRRRQGLRG